MQRAYDAEPKPLLFIGGCLQLRRFDAPAGTNDFLKSNTARQIRKEPMPAKKTQPAPKAEDNADPKLPVKTFRLGPIKAVVWENEIKEKTFFNVIFARTYMDKDNKFHDTESFGRDDLPLIAKLANQAHTFIYERLAKLRTEKRSE